MNQPLVTIIVPVYKVEKYLRRCLDSIAAQTYTNFEVILVDDGSPDRCGEICDEYAVKDTRFQVIHQRNGGVSAARNAGLDDYFRRNEKGYIFFVDSDDYIASNALEILVREALKGYYDIVIGGYSIVIANERVIWNSVWEEKNDAKQIRTAILCDQISNYACGKLYIGSLWKHIRFPEGLKMEDLYIIPKIFYRAKNISLISDQIYFYSQENENSISNNLEYSKYIRLRYDWFLAWIEHEKLAAKYAPEYREECIAHAIHRGVQAGLMNEAVKVLSKEENEKLLLYLRKNVNIPVKKRLEIGSKLLINDSSLKHIVGAIWCWNEVRKAKQKRKHDKKII